MSFTKDIQVGDYITIPAWSVEGMVSDTAYSEFGNDSAIKVAVQESPTSTPKWYRLEDGQFEFA